MARIGSRACQAGRQVVEGVDGGVGVIRARREGAHGHLLQHQDFELDVLVGAARLADRDAVIDGARRFVSDTVWWPQHGDGGAIDGVATGPDQQRYHHVVGRGCSEQPFFVASPPRVFAWHRRNGVGSGGFVREFGDRAARGHRLQPAAKPGRLAPELANLAKTLSRRSTAPQDREFLSGQAFQRGHAVIPAHRLG